MVNKNIKCVTPLTTFWLYFNSKYLDANFKATIVQKSFLIQKSDTNLTICFKNVVKIYF